MAVKLCLLILRESKVVQCGRSWDCGLEVVNKIEAICSIYESEYTNVIGDKLYNSLPNIYITFYFVKYTKVLRIVVGRVYATLSFGCYQFFVLVIFVTSGRNSRHKLPVNQNYFLKIFTYPACITFFQFRISAVISFVSQLKFLATFLLRFQVILEHCREKHSQHQNSYVLNILRS
jgi:hypothetical protein